MSLTIEKFKKMNFKDIYKYYENILNKLYEEYSVFFDSEKDYKLLIQQCVDNIEEQLNNEEVENLVENIIKDHIYKNINARIINNTTLLCKYINNVDLPNISNVKKLDYISSKLNKINSFFSFDIYTKIITESIILNSLISSIIEKNKNLIKNNGLDCLTYNNTSIQLLEIYCSINDIEVSEVDLESKEFSSLFSHYISEIPSNLLSKKEEDELFKRIKNNDKSARDKLIKHNLRLVISIASKYQGKGLELMDLIQEGNLGLMKAIELYDQSKGSKFSTYATYWIRQKITREIRNKGRVVRLPSHRYDEFSKIMKCIKYLEKELKRNPTLEEVAKELNISVEEVSNIYTSFGSTVSLNTLIGDDKETEIGDILPCESNSLENSIDSSMLSDEVKKLILSAKLSEKEISVITLRFGLSGLEPMTLEEVGTIYNVTRERIRQIEAKALSKFRKNKATSAFAVYMDSQEEAVKNLSTLKKGSSGKKKAFTNDHDDHESLKSIYEFCSEYKKEEVDEAISYLSPRDKQLIKITFENDLNNPKKISNSNKDDIKRIVKTIKTIILNLREEKMKQGENMGKKLKPLYEYFIEYTHESIDEAIKRLTEEERDIIRRAYGDDLNNPVRSNSFTSRDTDRLYGSIIPRLKTELKGRKNNRSLYKIFREFSKEEVDSCIEKLSAEHKDLLKKAYGDNLDQNLQSNKISKEESRYISTVIIKKIKKLLNGEQIGRNIKTLYKHFDNYTKEQIDLVISTLSEEDKLLIKRAYGDDLNNPNRSLDWTGKDSNRLYQDLFVRIKNLLKDKYLRKYFSIYEKLSEFSKEEIDKVIETLPTEDINIFKLAYGDDYQNPRRDILFNPDVDNALKRIIYKMKKILNKTERKKNKEIGKLYVMLKDYTKEDIDNVISSLNEGDKELLFRAYGSDYHNPVRALDFTKKEQSKLSSSLLPKIRKKLQSLQESREKNITVEEQSNVMEANDNSVKPEEIVEVSPVLDEKELDKDEMTKEAYMDILSLLKTPSFKELLTTLDVESAVIVVLKLGYIKDNYYSSASIGNFLDMSEEEVDKKFVQVLDLYKKSFCSFIDKAIETSKQKVFK